MEIIETSKGLLKNNINIDDRNHIAKVMNLSINMEKQPKNPSSNKTSIGNAFKSRGTENQDIYNLKNGKESMLFPLTTSIKEFKGVKSILNSKEEKSLKEDESKMREDSSMHQLSSPIERESLSNNQGVNGQPIYSSQNQDIVIYNQNDYDNQSKNDKNEENAPISHKQQKIHTGQSVIKNLGDITYPFQDITINIIHISPYLVYAKESENKYPFYRIYGYNIITKTSYYLFESYRTIGLNCDILHIGESIVLAGGSYSEKHALKNSLIYDNQSKYIKFLELTKPRCCPTLFAIDNCVYAICGHDEKYYIKASADCLKNTNSEWKEGIYIPFEDIGVAIYLDTTEKNYSLFIFGGTLKTIRQIKNVNMPENQWEIQNFDWAFCRVRAEVILLSPTRLLIFGGDNHPYDNYVFNLETKKIEETQKQEFNHRCFILTKPERMYNAQIHIWDKERDTDYIF